MSGDMPADTLRIAAVGQTFAGSRTPQRVAAMRALGHRVTAVPTTPEGWNYETKRGILLRMRHRARLHGDPAGANRRLIEVAEDGIDAVWIDNAAMIHAATLARVKKIAPRSRIIWFSEDDMMNPGNGSYWLDRALPLFDLWVTTKSYNAAAAEMPAKGARKVLFVDNACDPEIHRPVDTSAADQAAFGAQVSFIGSFEAERAQSMLALAESGQEVRVWGNGWGNWAGAHSHPNLKIEGRPVYDEEFSRVVASSDVNLGFLRKSNRDLQTCRSVEIPACGGFMAHERNPEIMALFAEDAEAVYFGDDKELIALCRRWLPEAERRAEIGRAARQCVLDKNLTHAGMVERALRAAFEDR